MRLIKLLLLSFFLSPAHAEQINLCDSAKGLELINGPGYSLPQIEMILAGCDKVAANDPQVLLLHGLVARKQAQETKNYLPAITWIAKAHYLAPGDRSISLELATTYELSGNPAEALTIYKSILTQDANNRPALLGEARIYRVQKSLPQALAIYNNLLTQSPQDVDALNGLAWVKAAQNELPAAQKLFQQSLTIQPANQEAQSGLIAIAQTNTQVLHIQNQCNVAAGFSLLNTKPPPIAEIQTILKNCDNSHIDTSETQLLHGLLARHQALVAQNYNEAISWLQKAMNSANKADKRAALELAVTYEWAQQLPQARAIYDYILAYEPGNRDALLGKARVLRLQHYYAEASTIYQQLIQHNPQDVEAINGLGWVELSQSKFQQATPYFQQTLSIQPTNQEAVIALQQIKAAELNPQLVHAPCPVAEGLKQVNEQIVPVAKITSILNQCEQVHFQDANVALLRGLLARHQGQAKQTLFWLQQARQLAAKDNQTPALELALTYEQTNQQQQAAVIYQQILDSNADNKAATLGLARTLRARNKLQQAQQIYQQLLTKNPKDTDALNGMGWLELAKNNLAQAARFFSSSIKVQPSNEEALNALKKIAYLKIHPPGLASKSPCDVNEALIILAKPKPDLAIINKIVQQCDKAMPKSTETLMLHALLARHLTHYKEAINWFTLAVHSAKPDDLSPTFELATTYEWANHPQKALLIYQTLLLTRPDNITALLGQARTLKAVYSIRPAVAAYAQILHKHPRNIDAINGLGETHLANYEFDKARAIFNRALSIAPHNQQTQRNLTLLNNATRNILGITGGHSAVPPNTSENINLFYFRNLNATDGLTLYATHNTKQIESGFSSGPTLLPNNSLLVGYQHLVPSQYGWQLSYDARQHDNRPFEHRVFGSTNLYLNNNLQWFGGLRLIFPNPWNTQLLISGLTLATPLPVNVTVTGFWSYQQIGGKSQSYALDFSREFSNRFFYDIGPSYLPHEKSWEMHGRVIIPTFRNQALVAEYSHYFFNRSTFATTGWRFYWA